MELNIIKNTESSSNMGSRFGQDVEPKGTYVLEKNSNFKTVGSWIDGTANIKNPLIIEITDDTLISYKYELTKTFKAKGQSLTDKLMSKGYDAIITKYKDGSKGEIILFPNCKFILNKKIELSEKYKNRIKLLSGF